MKNFISMDKKSKKKILQAFEVCITVTPRNTEFLGSQEPTVFKQSFTGIMAPISILEMAHFQFNKNSFLDQENMKLLNNGTQS